MYQSDDQSSEQSSASKRKERASQRIRQKGCDRATPNERRNHWPQLRSEISEADGEFPAQVGQIDDGLGRIRDQHGSRNQFNPAGSQYQQKQQ